MMEEPMNEKRDWQFDFVVEQLTREQAAGLLGQIIELVEEMDAVMGGGFYPAEEGDDGQEEDVG